MGTERMTSERLRMLATGGMTQTVFFEAVRARASEDEKDAEIARLRAALRPFATLARTFRDETGELSKSDERPVFGVNDTHLTVGDMRAALKALGEEA